MGASLLSMLLTGFIMTVILGIAAIIAYRYNRAAALFLIAFVELFALGIAYYGSFLGLSAPRRFLLAGFLLSLLPASVLGGYLAEGVRTARAMVLFLLAGMLALSLSWALGVSAAPLLGAREAAALDTGEVWQLTVMGNLAEAAGLVAILPLYVWLGTGLHLRYRGRLALALVSVPLVSGAMMLLASFVFPRGSDFRGILGIGVAARVGTGLLLIPGVLLFMRLLPREALEAAPIRTARKAIDQFLEPGRSLQDVEAQYAALFNAVPDAVFVCDEKGLVEHASAAGEEALGYHRSELAGRPLWRIINLGEDDQKAAGALRARLDQVQAGKVVRLESTLRQADGQSVPVEVSVSRAAPAGKYVAIAHNLVRQKRDSQTLRQQIAELDTLAEVSRIAASAKDTEELLKASADRLADLVKADRCWITQWHADTEQVVVAAAAGAEHERLHAVSMATNRGAPSLTLAVLEEQHPVVIEDYPRSRFFDPEREPLPSMRSLVALPLIADGRKLGAIVVGHDQAYTFAPKEVNTLERAANVVALSIAKMLLLEQMQERLGHALVLNQTAERLAAVVDARGVLDVLSEDIERTLAARVCAVLERSDSGLVLVRSAALEGSGADAAPCFSAEENPWVQHFDFRARPLIIEDAVSDERMAPLRPALQEQGVRSILLVPVQAGQSLGGLIVLNMADRGPLSASEMDLLDTIVRYGGVAIERSELVAEILAQKELAESLRQVTLALTGTLDYEEILDRILDNLMQVVACDAANIQAVQDGEARIIRSRGYEKVAPGADPHEVRIPLQQVLSYRQMLETHRPDFVADIEADPNWYSPPGAPKLWLRSWAGAPVVVRDVVIGFLNLDSASKTYTQREADILALFANEAAIALENARLYGESQEHRAIAETLREAGMTLASTLVREEILDRILVMLERLVPYSAANIQLVRKGRVVVTRHRGYEKFGAERAVEETHFVINDVANLRHMRDTRAPHHVTDTASDPNWVLVPDLTWPRSWAGAPIVVRDQVTGFINVETEVPNTYSQRHAELLALFASQAAVALENAQLYEQSQQQLKELTALYRAAEGLRRPGTPRSLAADVINALGEILGYDHGSVMTVEQATGALKTLALNEWGRGAAFRKSEWKRVESYKIHLGQGITGWVAEHGESLNVPDVLQDPRYLAVRTDVLSELCVPMWLGDQVIGVVNVESTRANAYSESDQRLLETIAAQLAIAIQNAQLYEDLQTAYDRLKETQEEAMRSERLQALGQMASGIAHDFNNVLTPILGYLELVSQHPQLPEEIQADVERARRGALAASSIVARLREFYRPREAEEALRPVDLGKVVREALDLTRPRWRDIPQEHGAVVDVDLRLGDLPPVRGDANALRDVLTNLLLNAVDAMPAGGTFRVQTWREGDQAVLVVSDTGVGMTEEVKRHAFEPFFSTKGSRGTGLGLAMCYGIIQRHGGSIDVESTLGVGTTFRVRLPLSADTLPLAPDASLPTLPPLTVLVVDDDQAVLSVVSRMLTRAGHAVLIAASGAEGLDRFDPSRVDLVITDLGMPEVTGRDVAARVKAVSPDTPVILFTGWGAKVGAEELAPPEVDVVLSKPVQSVELHRALARVLGLLQDGRPVAP